GRVDGLEARVGTLEAQQFSTTTKLVGQATMVVGANSFGGEKALVKAAENQSGAAVFNYDLRLDLNTSFDGEDLLKTRLRAGNFADSPFGSDGYNGLSAMEVAFGEEGDEDEVTVDRLYYQFPVGDDFTVTAGAKVRQDDMLAVWPSAYPADTIIDFFTYAGAPGAYSLTLGGGAGIWWQQDNCDNAENCGGGEWSISASYVSANADNANPNRQDRPVVGNDPTGGIGTDAAGSTTTAQIAFTDEQWGIAAVYSYSSGDNGAGLYAGNGTPLAVALQGFGTQNSFGLSGYWMPEESGWFPSISAGWGISSTNPNEEHEDILDSVTTQSWYVGLMWDDAFIEGNTLGVAGGQPTFVTDLDLEAGSDTVEDANYAFELWYKFQVTDNISVTPAIFYFTRPLGENTGSEEDEFTNFGGLVKTTFKF
ncbi:MAG TPA: iron uptake porin, partial [Prochlorococcus sp.]